MVDVAAEDVDASELFYEPCFEGVPVGDGIEGTSFLSWHGLKGDEQLGRVVALGEGESVEGGGQPGIEIIGFSAPHVSD